MPKEKRPVHADAGLLRAPADPLDPGSWREGGDVGAPDGDDPAGDVRGGKARGRKSGASPTARSLEKLRREGYLAGVVERWNAHAKPHGIRIDLFGFIDILAVRRGEVLGVQATSGAHVAARAKKIAEHENVARVRESGMRIEIHGWRKLASGRWECRTMDVS